MLEVSAHRGHTDNDLLMKWEERNRGNVNIKSRISMKKGEKHEQIDNGKNE